MDGQPLTWGHGRVIVVALKGAAIPPQVLGWSGRQPV
jgi:hypothetical protein